MATRPADFVVPERVVDEPRIEREAHVEDLHACHGFARQLGGRDGPRRVRISTRQVVAGDRRPWKRLAGAAVSRARVSRRGRIALGPAIAGERRIRRLAGPRSTSGSIVARTVRTAARRRTAIVTVWVGR